MPDSPYLHISSIDSNLNSLSGTYEATGLDFDGNPATMSVNYSATAYGTVDSLKGSVSAEVDNFFFNPDNNPYIINSLYDIDPKGIPTMLQVRSANFFVDTMNVAGADDLSFVKLSFHIDGAASSVSDDGIVVLSQIASESHPIAYSVFQESWVGGGSGNVDTNVMSFAMPVIDNQVFVWFLFENILQFYPEAFPTFKTGSLDFSSTVSFVEFVGFNTAGEQVDLVDVIGSGGFHYDTVRVSPVPEPATIALLSSGLVVIGFARRRSSTK